MTEETDAAREEGDGKKKGGKKPLVIGAAAMVLCGAGAFAAVSMMGGAEAPEAHAEEEGGHDDGHGGDEHAEADAHGEKDQGTGAPKMGSVAFVPVDPLTVSLAHGARPMHLRFTSQLEVPHARQEEVASLMPRIVDALGGYLRALEPDMLADRDAHLRIRGQMLRRVRLVVGPDAVHDLLVTEFVVN